jgi:hypothetical protein
MKNVAANKTTSRGRLDDEIILCERVWGNYSDKQQKPPPFGVERRDDSDGFGKPIERAPEWQRKWF